MYVNSGIVIIILDQINSQAFSKGSRCQICTMVTSDGNVLKSGNETMVALVESSVIDEF
jgi:hypothetical protein